MTQREIIDRRMKEYKLNHAEAFCLMLYRAKDGHEEWLWNSRDGVTPFCIMSRNGQEMQHVEWHRDSFQPNRQPKVGDRIFVDVTRELAEPKLREYIDRFWEEGNYPMKTAYGSKKAAFERLLPGRTEPGQPFVLELTEENIGQYVKADLEKQIETLSQQAESLKAPSQKELKAFKIEAFEMPCKTGCPIVVGREEPDGTVEAVALMMGHGEPTEETLLEFWERAELFAAAPNLFKEGARMADILYALPEILREQIAEMFDDFEAALSDLESAVAKAKGGAW